MIIGNYRAATRLNKSRRSLAYALLDDSGFPFAGQLAPRPGPPLLRNMTPHSRCGRFPSCVRAKVTPLPPDPTLRSSIQPLLQALAGYLNFSSGAPDRQFDRQFNEAFAAIEGLPTADPAWRTLRELLDQELTGLAGSSPAFATIDQAQAVLRLAFDYVLPAYRERHRDLLADRDDRELFRPYFLSKTLQAVLRQEAPWDETERITAGALASLNDLLGHRPVAVLRTEQKIEPYPNEWVSPIPLYLAGAGVAAGRYQALIAEALDVLRDAPQAVLDSAYFDLGHLDELALDPRAYDFDHPVNKRPNYHFGQWDPHKIDNAGNYRRFVLQAVTLDALLERVERTAELPREELLREAAIVLAGTMLMGSGVSGSGPDAHDSDTTLTTLLPRIAGYRDAFYSSLLATTPGPHGERLRAEAAALKQPFGGARQDLNQRLARLRAAQLQHVHLAQRFAAMGNLEASARQAWIVPVASARMLSEIGGRITVGRLAITHGDVAAAAQRLSEVDELIRRGIQCGALVDPWNILGFQGQFSLFPALENTVRDHRVDVLIHVVSETFSLAVETAAAAAAQGADDLLGSVQAKLATLADWWDRFATLDVSNIESVSGREAVAAAAAVSSALSAWRLAGATGGDIAFWRKQVGAFQSPKAYALVIETLLNRGDTVAAMSLLISWLSQSEQTPLAEGEYSFYRLAQRWLQNAMAREKDRPSGGSATTAPSQAPGAIVAKFFDYLEANAGALYAPPRLGLGLSATEDDDQALHSEKDDDEGDDNENLFDAAYEGVSYLDSTDDSEGSMIEGAELASNYELDLEVRRLRGPIEFARALARLRLLVAIRPALNGSPAPRATNAAIGPLPDDAAWNDLLAGQLAHACEMERGLTLLLTAIHRLKIPRPSNSPTSLLEYDRRRRVKEGLAAETVAAVVDAATAVRWMRARLGAADSQTYQLEPQEHRWQTLVESALVGVLRGDATAVRAAFPTLDEELDKLPILYVPLERGGDPVRLAETQSLKQTLLELFTTLPKLSLLAESGRLLATVQRMERHRPQQGRSVTEFDRLFETAFRAIVESLIDSSERWSASATSASEQSGNELNGADAELVEVLQMATEPLLRSWLEHSRSVRLSVVERVAENDRWTALVEFIERYGHDLFTQRFLNIGNLRAIADQGVDAYLRILEEEPDPLHPIRLIEDLDNGIARATAVELLQTIVEAIIENYAEYKDFNATTTQSDRGELLYTLIDFLRLKASYDRVTWNIRPVVLVHEALMRRGRLEAAEMWRRALAERTSEVADWHLARFNELVERYRMRLPSVAARLHERFVGPLAIDRLRALVTPAVREIEQSGAGPAFALLEQEIGEFAEQPSGSGLDVPAWLLALEEEVSLAQRPNQDDPLAELAARTASTRLSRAEVERQLREWESNADADSSTE